MFAHVHCSSPLQNCTSLCDLCFYDINYANTNWLNILYLIFETLLFISRTSVDNAWLNGLTLKVNILKSVARDLFVDTLYCFHKTTCNIQDKRKRNKNMRIVLCEVFLRTFTPLHIAIMYRLLIYPSIFYSKYII